MKQKVIKQLLIYFGVFVALTAIWSAVFIFYLLPKYTFKTQAKVISFSYVVPSSSKGGRQVNKFPTYEYLDNEGNTKKFISKDGFNRINGILFGKEVGESYTAYYEIGSDDFILITQTGDWYTVVLAPMVFSIFPFGPIFALYIYLKNRNNK